MEPRVLCATGCKWWKRICERCTSGCAAGCSVRGSVCQSVDKARHDHPIDRQEAGIVAMLMHSRSCGSCGLLVICAGNRSVIPRLGAKVDGEAEVAAAAARRRRRRSPGRNDDDHDDDHDNGIDNGDDQQTVSIVPRGSSVMVTGPGSRQGPPLWWRWNS